MVARIELLIFSMIIEMEVNEIMNLEIFATEDPYRCGESKTHGVVGFEIRNPEVF